MRRHGTFQVAALAAALSSFVAAEPQHESVPVRLLSGVRLTRPIESGAPDRVLVALAGNQFVRIIVMQTGIDVAVSLSDPQGRELMTSDLPNGAFGAETVAAVSELPGEYVVEVKPSTTSVQKGFYEVFIDVLHDAAPGDRELVSAYQSLIQCNLLRKKRTPETRRQALDLLQHIRPVFASAGDAYSQAWTEMMSWEVLAESGEIARALPYAEAAVDLFHRAGDLRSETQARNNAGGMVDVLGEPQKALDAYRQALALTRITGDHSQEATELNNIAKIQTDQGDWQAAMENYRTALEAIRQVGDTRREATYAQNLGVLYWYLGDYEQALSILQDALALRRKANDRAGEGLTLKALGSTYIALHQANKALEVLDQALAAETAVGDRRREAEVRRSMGAVYSESGKFAEADQAFRSSIEGAQAARDRRNAAIGLRELSQVLLRENRSADALSTAEEALGEFHAIGDRPSEAGALEAIARAEAARGNLAQARDRMADSLRIVETSRTQADNEQFRATFLATRQESYAFYIDVLVRLGDSAAAFEAAERARARSLLDLLADSGAKIREGVDSKLLTRERELTALLNAKGARLLPMMGRDTPQAAALKGEIRKLETEYQDVEAGIRKSSPRYAALTQPEPMSLAGIQARVLDSDSVLLEYSLGESRGYLWAVGRDSLKTFELHPRAQIEAQVREVCGLLAARSEVKRMETAAGRQKRIEAADAALSEATRRLSAMVLSPALSAIAGKRLLIAADGALQRLPFAMLTLPDSGEPLVTAHEIVMLPSASALAALRAETAGRAPAPKLLAVFADPVFDASDPRVGRTAASTPAASADSTRILQHLAEPGGETSASLRIPRLPFTAQEAEQILRVAGSGSNWKAEGFDASRAAAISGRLSQYRYIHFATHGVLDTERPSLSALVLSQLDENRKPQDGFLRVNDIYNAHLAADLVVLSACQTGLGKEVRGEGLMGLSRAFLYAGAPRVIVSLWNVNDRATAILMGDLYRGMLRGGMRPSTALRAAQLELRIQKRWESPYYWAAFVQHGDW